MNLPFRFAISDGAGNYWRRTGGVVSLSAAIKYLRPSVVDWATLSLNYRRDMVFLGVLRSYSPEVVRFVKDAAEILRHIKNTQGGAEAKAYLAMYVYNKAQLRYDFLDYWQFDFSKSKNEELYYQITLMDGGLSAALKANANNNYSIPLNDPALAPDFPLYNPLPANELPLTPPTNIPIIPATPKLILMDGIPILGIEKYITFNTEEFIVPTDDPVGMQSIGLTGIETVDTYKIGTKNNNLENRRDGFSTIGDTMSFRAALTAKANIEWNLNFNYRVLTGAAGLVGVRIELRFAVYSGSGGAGGWGTMLDNGVLQTSAFIPRGAIGDFHWKGISRYFNLQKDNVVVVGFGYVKTGSTPGGDVEIRIPEYEITPATIPLPAIKLNTVFIPESSICRAISHGQLFEQLTAYMATNGGRIPFAYSSRSNLLNTFRSSFAAGNWDLNPQCTFFTCGDSLRGLKAVSIVDPYYNSGNPFDSYIVPAINTNMADFAKDLLPDLCAGIGIEKTGIGTEKLVAEELFYFFDDDTIIADLGDNISDFVMEDFNDFRGSGIEFGQPDQQFDSINGPLETMSEVSVDTPMVRVNKKIDFKTPYRRDPYGIELTRANIGNKTNVNSSSDNDTFKLQTTGVIPTEVEVLEDWTGLSGYETVIEALLLMRGTNILSGLPKDLLTPDVNPYAMYNLSFTPQRTMRRNLPWLCSNYRGLVDSVLSISGKKKNIQLISNLGSGDIRESDWINVGPNPITYTPPFSSTPVTVAPATIPAGRTNNLLWLPYTFSFTGPSIKDLPLKMTPPGTPGGGKMYGKIKFIMTRGKKKYPLAGFVMDIGITPGTNATCNYKLLCSPTVVIPSDL